MNFHIVKVGSRPLLAYSDGAAVPAALRSRAIECYPAHTWKKRWLRRGLVCAARLGILNRICPASSVPLPGVSDKEFSDWLIDIDDFLPASAKHCVFIWPGDPERGRIYCHLLDARGERIGFCKFALDDQNNRLIGREAVVLNQLGNESLRNCRVPKLMSAGAIDDINYVLVETTPIDVHAIDWNDAPSMDFLINEYSGSTRRIPRQELETLDWWCRILKIFSNRSRLIGALREAIQDGVEVCRVHGDLNRTNILVGGTDTWLLDWERSDDFGPVETDRICVAVDQLWFESPMDSKRNLNKLKEMFPELQNRKTQGPCVLGLAFLGAVGFTPALSILTEWFPEETQKSN